MSLACKTCQKSFPLTAADSEILRRFQAPPPVQCPDCRMQRRVAFRNDRHFHKRACDLCKKMIISTIAPDTKHVVYCADCFWSDAWDPCATGKLFDFNRSFTEQYRELLEQTPLLCTMVVNSINCDYNNGVVNSKDCYLSARMGDSEKILYTYLAVHSLGCVDCFNISYSQYCYECIDCLNCYNVAYSQNCKNTSDSLFCYDCIGCKNCFGCVGLRNVEHFFFNEKCTKKEYEKRLAEYSRGSFQAIQKTSGIFAAFAQEKPKRALHLINTENVQGDYSTDSKNIVMGFDIEHCESGAYCWGSEYCKDIYDGTFLYYGENHYQSLGSSHSTNIRYAFMTFSSSDLDYCMLCFNNCKNCFGCVSLKQKEYCILNRQYSKDEYEKLVPRIIEHMKKSGEYGQYFDPSLSFSPYNETVAQDYFPLSREKAMALGFSWRDPDVKEYQPQTHSLPDRIQETPNEIIQAILACEQCTRNFKIDPSGLELHRQMEWPLPRNCPNCRFLTRLSKRNPRRLFERPCGKCGKLMSSSYASEDSQIVYCEACYKKEIYGDSSNHPSL